jgi:hypothetical protein
MIFRHWLATSFSLLLLSSCGGSGGGGSTVLPPPALLPTLRLAMASEPPDGIQALVLGLSKAEIQGPSGQWHLLTLTAQALSLDLAALASAKSPALGAATLPAPGTYGPVRLTLASGARVRWSDGRDESLLMPGTVFQVPLQVQLAAGSSAETIVVVDPLRSIQRRDGGNLLIPSAWAVQEGATGSLSGQVVNALAQPLAGVTVTAQWFEALGTPLLARRAITGTDGRYSLNFLPLGRSYFVVTWPAENAEPKSSAAQSLDLATPARQVAAIATVPLANHAAVHGTIYPPASLLQADEVWLIFGPIMAGSNPEIFLVGMQAAVAVAGQPSYRFRALLPGSTYQTRSVRTTWAADGSSTQLRRYSDDYGFLPGSDHVLDIYF